MFSNPIKRLSESLAQAQEQARQQLQKSQRPADAKALVNAEGEGTSLVEEGKSNAKDSSDEKAARNSDEVTRLSTSEKSENLPKEVRIKLAKLAKYEERHPKLQAAYKESQGRIATFEKVLRERTPLGSIDEVDDFGNYLNTLSVRTNMSLEELKRVTEAHENLKIELNIEREKSQQGSESLAKVVKDIWEQLEKALEEIAHYVTVREELEAKLKEKDDALESEQRMRSSAEREIEKLREDLRGLENQRLKQSSISESITEDVPSLTLETSPTSVAPSTEEFQLKKSPSDTPIATPEESTGGAKKKKKKKKKTAKLTASTETPQPTTQTPAEDPPKMQVDTLSRTLLEGYLAELNDSLKKDDLQEPGAQSLQLAKGTELWDDSVSQGMQPASLLGLKAALNSLSKHGEVSVKVKDLEKKLSGFTIHVNALTGQLESANDKQRNLKHQLEEAQKELQDAKEYEQRLLEKTRRLEATSEDVEQLRDMLRDVGSDLMEAKDKVKELEEKEKTALATKAELETKIDQLTNDLSEERKVGASVKETQDQSMANEALAATRLKELNEATGKLTTVEADLVSVRSDLATVSADKIKLTANLAELSTKYQTLERVEREARESIASTQAKLALKEKEVNQLRADLNDLKASKTNIEESLRSTKQALATVESERNEFQRLERNTRDESVRLKRDVASFQEKIAALESVRASLRNERAALTEEVHVKTAQVESAKSLMQNLREQTTEMGHRAREAKERCEALEEELSEAHKLLSERAREAGTMRRLLDEAEGQEAGRIKEARDKLEVAIEERDQLVEEITLLRMNNAKGSGLMDKSLQEKEMTVKDLSAKYEATRKEVEELRKINEDVQIKLQQARKEADESMSKLQRLSQSLEETTAQTQQLQAERNAIKETAEESQLRVEQLQRTQRHLSEELKRLKAAADKKAPPSPSPRDSRVSLVESRSPTMETTRQSISSNGADPTKAAIDREYIRNVLVQFFEHKDKRAQLLPVLSMLLNFSKADEMKLLR